MAWNTITAPVTGAVISLTNFGLKVIANLNYLFGERPLNFTTYQGTAITSTSTSWVAVDTTNARITQTINSGRVQGKFTLTANITFSVAGAAYIYFTVYKDGTTNLGDATYGLALHASSATRQQVTIPFIATGLSVGSHTFDLYWKLVTVSGTVSAIRIECDSANGGVPIIKEMLEV